MAQPSCSTASFRSVLPHEPLPKDEFGYIHIQGSFEPKKSKKEGSTAEPFWTQASLKNTLTSSAVVQSMQGLRELQLMEQEPPFSKVRFVLESSEAAYEVLRTWRRLQLTPLQVLSEFCASLEEQGQVVPTFTVRQFQVTQITTVPMPPTSTAWTRSNPPKFRRLLHSDGVSLEEERSQARFVFISNLIPDGPAPCDMWKDNHAVIAAIRAVVHEFDSSGQGVEVFVPHKSIAHHCHVGMRKPADAQKLIASLQGLSITWKLSSSTSSDTVQEVQSPKLFLDYADITQRSVQRSKRTDGLAIEERGEPSRSECTSNTDDITVPGLYLIPDFVSEAEEQVLMASITGPQAPWAPAQIVPSKKGSVRRRVQHYGYVFDYETADVLRNRAASDGAACPALPACSEENLEDHMAKSIREGLGWEALAGVVERTRRHKIDDGKGTTFPNINQVTVNEYRPGEGIGSHVDTPSAFGDGLLSLSLNSGIVMEFRNTKQSNVKKLVYLPARSLLVLTGPARYEWEHMIVTRRTDTHNGVVKPRGLRVSLTLRTALELPEQGGMPLKRVESSVYPPIWGSRQNVATLQTPETERQHVHAVYDAIATQWHHTRGKRGVLWPGATEFLQQLPRGSVVADVGCGDGKYFPAIWGAGSYVIGTDISVPLLQTCNVGTETAETRFVSSTCQQLRNRPAVAAADCMMLPLRDKSVDAAICIAVLHHLSTLERRVRCLQELKRIVQPGGLINVQAWALDQNQGSRRKFASTDVFVPFNAQPKYLDKQQQQADAPASSNSVAEQYAETYDGAEYDERKGLVVFQRYCHMYREGELDELAMRVEGLDVVESGYENGNYFMILRVTDE